MSLIDARLPSFSTSVLESTLSGCPATVRVLLDRSNRSTEPWISFELEVVLEAVAPVVSLVLVPDMVDEPVPVPDIVESLPVAPVAVPVLEGVLVVPVDDGVLPIEPLAVSSVVVLL